MYLLFWIAAAWLVAAMVVTGAFLGARYSQRLYGWLFGERPTAEVRRLAPAALASRAQAQPVRLAA